MVRNRRPQVGDLPDQPGIQPQASPVSTYAPARVSDVAPPITSNGLSQLVDSLGGLSRTLIATSETKAKQEVQQMSAEGATLAAKNKLDYNQAVTQGLIHQGANPWLKFGYERGQLRNLGLEYGTALQTQWANSPVKNDTTNPDSFNQFLQGNRQSLLEKVQGYDPRSVQDVLLPLVQANESKLANEHANYQQKLIVNQNLDQLELTSTKQSQDLLNNATQILQQTQQEKAVELTKTLTDAQEKEVEQRYTKLGQKRIIALFSGLGEQLQQAALDGQAHGLSSEQVAERLAKGLINTAKATGNTKVLDLAEFIAVDGKGTKLSQTQYGAEHFADERLNIEKARLDLDSARDAQAERDRKQATRAIETTLAQGMIDALEIPGTAIQDTLGQLAQKDPDKARQWAQAFMELREKQQKQVDTQQSEAAVNNTLGEIYADPTKVDPLAIIKNPYLSPDQKRQAIGDLRRAQDPSNPSTKAVREYAKPTINSLLSLNFRQETGKGGFELDSVKQARANRKKQIQEAGKLAGNHLLARTIVYLNQHPDASFEQVSKFLNTELEGWKTAHSELNWIWNRSAPQAGNTSASQPVKSQPVASPSRRISTQSKSAPKPQADGKAALLQRIDRALSAAQQKGDQAAIAKLQAIRAKVK